MMRVDNVAVADVAAADYKTIALELPKDYLQCAGLTFGFLFLGGKRS